MSVNTNQPRGMNVPRPRSSIVPVTQENVRDWWALLVNRKAYTRQSANPHPETGRHYHYQPKNKDSGQPLELDPPTVRKHLVARRQAEAIPQLGEDEKVSDVRRLPLQRLVFPTTHSIDRLSQMLGKVKFIEHDFLIGFA